MPVTKFCPTRRTGNIDPSFQMQYGDSLFIKVYIADLDLAVFLISGSQDEITIESITCPAVT